EGPEESRSEVLGVVAHPCAERGVVAAGAGPDRDQRGTRARGRLGNRAPRRIVDGLGAAHRRQAEDEEHPTAAARGAHGGEPKPDPPGEPELWATLLASVTDLCAEGDMVHVDPARWNQTPDDLRRLALEAPHPRTRERFLALYEVATHRSAFDWSKEAGRR